MSGFEPLARQENPEMLRLLDAVWTDVRSLDRGRAVMALYARYQGEWRAFVASDAQRAPKGSALRVLALLRVPAAPLSLATEGNRPARSGLH